MLNRNELGLSGTAAGIDNVGEILRTDVNRKILDRVLRDGLRILLEIKNGDLKI